METLTTLLRTYWFWILLPLVLGASAWFIAQFTTRKPRPQLQPEIVALANVENRQVYQLGLFSEYHEQGLLQSKVTFICSLVFAALGFAVIVSSLVYLLAAQSPELRLLRAELQGAKASEKQAYDALDRRKTEYRASQERQKKVEEEKRRSLDLLEAEANSLAEEYDRLASSANEPVEPAPARYGKVKLKSRSLIYSQDGRDVLISLQENARVALLRAYIAAIPVFTNQLESLKKDVVAIISGNATNSYLLETVGKLIPSPNGLDPGRHLEHFIELAVRMQFVNAPIEKILIQNPDPTSATRRGVEIEGSLASELEDIIDELGRVRRSLEQLHNANLDPTFARRFEALESTNRTRRAILLEKLNDINRQIQTNAAGAYSYGPYSHQATNQPPEIQDATQELSRHQEHIQELESQIKDLGEPTKTSGKSAGTQPLAIMGVIAGTIIDAIAALFFVQSNRAKEVMVQFFDRLRHDRMLDEALKLAPAVPDSPTKSLVYRELILMLASDRQPPALKESSQDNLRKSRSHSQAPTQSNGDKHSDESPIV